MGPSVIGHTTYNYVLKYLQAYVVSTVVLLEPIIASLLGYIIFGEVLFATTFIGATLVITGIYITTRYRGKEP